MARSVESLFDLSSMVRNRLFSRQHAKRVEVQERRRQFLVKVQRAEPYLEDLQKFLAEQLSLIVRKASMKDVESLCSMKAYQTILDKIKSDVEESRSV